MSKSAGQNILIVSPQGSSQLAEILEAAFAVCVVASVDEVLQQNPSKFAVVVLDTCANDFAEHLSVCQRLKGVAGFADVPVILLVADTTKLDMKRIYDAGADDIIIQSLPGDAVIVQLNQAIFHTVANRQLKSRLQQANEMVFSAMSDTSDLGVNIQFLVHCHECNNLDELGMLLFRTLSHYQIHCSLQIRSEFETKNLEENGLSKDLEARLLWELKDSGRYVDFGRRCVMNYGNVSLLVKKMPEDSRRFGSIKDNVFSLLQGADARVKSIDGARMLEMERDVLRGLAHKMQTVMQQVDDRYQVMMKESADLVEDMAMKVEQAILFLDLTEQQEEVFSRIMQTGVASINHLFNNGIKIDASFRKLVDHLNSSLAGDERASVTELRRVLDRL